MPVEIKELIIRAVVSERQEDTPEGKGFQGVTNEQEAMITECVRQVLKILKKSKER